jgi:hypothetical protein
VLLLAALRQAGGAPVSYSHLRDAGIEFPASVVSELELMGVQIERCYEHAERSRHPVGVRLDPAHDDRAISCDLSDVRVPEPLFESMPAAAAAAAAADLDGAAIGPVAGTRRPGAWSRRPVASFGVAGTIAVAASIAVMLVVVALSAGGARAGHAPTKPHTRSAAPIAAAPTRSAAVAPSGQTPQTQTPQTQTPQTQTPQTPQAQPTYRPAATLVSATLAAQLEAHGHELLQTGQSASAVPVLERALDATGESLHGCEQPSNEQCLTYAYALYDLGRALLLSGSPAAAVGVLEHRLQIENQQPVVAAELASARRQLG